MKKLIVTVLAVLMILPCINISAAQSAVDISTQRQLFTDNYIIDKSLTTTERVYGKPVKNESVMVFDKSYEANGAVYFSIVDMHDGSYRMYYKATASNGKRRICYIESTDGLTWTRPKLSTNSSYLNTNVVTKESASPDNLFVFYDKNPAVTGNAKIKGIYGQWGDGLYLENCTKMGDSFQFWPNETKIMGTAAQMMGCYFDSLNTVYYDSIRGKYIAFVRGFHEDDNYNLSTDYVGNNPGNVVRDIRYAESDDCYSWSTPKALKYSDDNDWQMYTNAISPYLRAPQIYVGLPTRFNYGANTTDVLFMSSRDLKKWERTEEAFLSPSVAESSSHGDCYPSVGFIETGDELSFYMQEKNSKGVKNLYRYSLRLDGFAYQKAVGAKTLVTKPFTFEGESLEINYAGNVKVTLTDTEGNSITSGWINGDSTSHIVDFDGDVADFEGRTVTLTFEMEDAQLYSFKFNKDIDITADILSVNISDTDMLERTWYAKGEYTTKEEMFASDTLVDISGKSKITVANGGVYTFLLYLKDGSRIVKPVNVGLYNITYRDMGADSFSGILPETAPVNHTYKVTTKLVSPTREGYTFGGWYNERGTKVTTLAKTSYTDDITLYAKWTANSYTVSYKDQAGKSFSGKQASGYLKKHTYGTETLLLAPTKTGYIFKGWYLDKACETTPVTSLGATEFTANITVYAKWEVITCDITYRDMGDNDFSGVHPTGTPLLHTYGINTTLKKPTKDGYTFSGWYLNPECTGSKLSSLAKSSYTEDVTLYAKWTANQYTITYRDKGNGTFSGKNPSGYATKHTYDIDTLLPIPTKTGYTFMGWYLDRACETTPVSVLNAGEYTESIKLYAKWEVNVYSITYLDRNGEAFSGTLVSGTPTTHTYGKATTLKNPTREGYTFGGWYTDAACTKKVTSLGKTTYTSDITLYAKWTAK